MKNEEDERGKAKESEGGRMSWQTKLAETHVAVAEAEARVGYAKSLNASMAQGRTLSADADLPSSSPRSLRCLSRSH
jgi:hypothetical protein